MKLMIRKRIAPLFLVMSLAFIGLAMLITMPGDSVSAQNPLCDVLGVQCEDTPTPVPTPEPTVNPILCATLGICTPTPTNTPVPTATNTPVPTATAVLDTPTRTPRPTRTPKSTSTPRPTSTPDPNAPPTATPKATATPVATESVTVMAVEGATTVEPDMQVQLMAGNVTVKFPTLSRARTFQAMLSESSDCGDMALACAMVSIYNAEGEMESDVRLISSAEIVIMLDAGTVSELGGGGLNGGAVALQANALGGIMLQLMDDGSGEWNSIPFDFDANSDGSVTITGVTRRFSQIALNVNPDVVEQARMQLSSALGTPTATPIPTATPVPPTPTATATPVPPTPEPTATPVPPPDTGDASVPFLMLLAMAIAASMLALVGTKVIAARMRR